MVRAPAADLRRPACFFWNGPGSPRYRPARHRRCACRRPISGSETHHRGFPQPEAWLPQRAEEERPMRLRHVLGIAALLLLVATAAPAPADEKADALIMRAREET